MKCSRCKKEIDRIYCYTSGEYKMICEDCLKKEIYEERKKIIKKAKKKRVKKTMENILIGIFIGFGISYITLMILMIIKLIIR